MIIGHAAKRGGRAGLLGAVLLGGLLVACHHAPPAEQPAPDIIDATAPDSFLVRFVTSRGLFAVTAHREWAPKGVDRFYYLVRHHFYDGARFFRVLPGFVAQFGISSNPAENAEWAQRPIADEPVRHTNSIGTVAFARDGPNSRTVQLYVNLKDNPRLDTVSGFGFPPIAQVTSGFGIVDSLYGGYGEGPPRGRGPSQDSIALEGNAYLRRHFPRLDYIVRTEIEREWK